MPRAGGALGMVEFADHMDSLFNKLQMETLSEGTRTNHWKGETINGLHWDLYRGDIVETLSQLDENTFNCVVTSPPYYWQRDYQSEGQIGLEKTIDEYVRAMKLAMQSVNRVLRKDGVLFLNLGDTYYSGKGQPKGDDKKNKARRMGLRAVDASGLGVPRKTTIGIPWRVALAMIEDGWVLRSPIIWRREGVLPEFTSVDRPWRTYEMLFMFTKSQKYFFDRTKLNGEEDIWTISGRPKTDGVHNAAFPEELVQKCLSVGCPAEGIVLDPFAGSGTTLRVALQTGRNAVGVDISDKYCHYIASTVSKV